VRLSITHFQDRNLASPAFPLTIIGCPCNIRQLNLSNSLNYAIKLPLEL
jgi:hypothetical protein